MDKSYLWADPQGRIKIISDDKMPIRVKGDIQDSYHLERLYELALQRAKEQAIPIQNEIVAVSLIAHGQTIIDLEKAKAHYCKPGEVYGPFALRYEVKSVLVLEKNTPGVSRIRHYEKRAILYDDTPEKEENQDELWMEVMVDSHGIETIGVSKVIRQLKEKFTITRK